ncbi:Flagellar biosynthetic protein FliR [Buchnera aphidicola (Eriosoma lanigerum)]|uniref:flagellar biosynthetic protein FliR n=1 Tax=Buchnera aphidicola TaxID=9 RepID=UPI003463876B
MLTINSIEFFHLLNNIFLPFVRILSLFLTAPIFNERVVFSKIKIIISIFFSFLITPFLPDIHIDFFSSNFLLIFIQQMIIGIFLGFSVQIIFSAANMAGEIISTQIGLSFSNYFDINTRNNSSSITRLLNILFLFLFLSFNGHLWILSILFDSFYRIPIDYFFLNVKVFLLLIHFSSFLFVISLKLSFPIIILILILNCIMAFLNRISPQISIFSIGFPIILLLGIFLLYFLIPFLAPFFQNLFLNIQKFLLNVMI